MATTVRLYRISGTVTDVNSGKGVANIRVEAWDRNTGTPVIFGKGVTDTSGNYQITIDESVFGSPAPTKIPDIFLKSFSGSTGLTETGDTVLKGGPALATSATANLKVDMSAFKTPPQDRLTSQHIQMGIDFLHLSDFRGVYRETLDRVSTAKSSLFGSAKTLVTGIPLTPLKPSAVRTLDVVNQDPGTAQTRLQAQGVTVNQVTAYTPGVAIQTTQSLLTNLKAGDKVNLVVDNGVVKGYTVVTPPAQVVNAADVQRLQSDVADLKTQLTQVQTATTAQTQSITQTNTDIAALKAKAALVDQLQTQVATLQQSSAQKDTTITNLQTRLATVETNFQKLNPPKG